ncbi:MAG: DinB family protein [Planctomycetota bacterium]
MNTKEAIRASADLSRLVLTSFVSDLDDSELMIRPGEGCNHLAFQLGHLIAAECQLLEMVKPGAAIALPEGFAEQHSKEAAGEDDPAKFHTKQEYLDLLDKVTQATMAALEATSDEELDTPSPEHFAQFAPTHGHIYSLIATHPMMHAGQFVPVRRKLGKPVLM